MNVYNKYINDAYKNTLPYPVRPPEPVVLRKRAAELTADELANFTATKERHEQSIEAFNAARVVYNQETGRLQNQLRLDLEDEHGVSGNPKAGLLWDKAWDRGHGSGLGDVISVYGDLVELIT